jgi:Ca2+-binding EF-hand superfamily protein
MAIIAVVICLSDTARLSGETVGRPVSEVFAELDTDGDKRLSPEEYAAGQPSEKVRLRDFQLFDWNHDGQLSRREFGSAPQPGTGKRRIEMPDPFDEVLERAVNALDESYEGWQRRPDETVDSTTFTINYSASISIDGRRRLDRVMILHADANRDRKVSRDEARRFLEIQLGIRWFTGDLLRHLDGRVVDFAKFIEMDVNQDNQLGKSEFIETWPGQETAEEDFLRMDIDGDDDISLAEFADSGGLQLRDPIETFRHADVNLDALLDLNELQAATPESHAHLIRLNLSAFDDDSDGKLSLTEYRLSMLGNANYPWQTLPEDKNGDDQISFEEFRFHPRNLFQLQRRYYFHRLDQDADGKLSPSELQFKRRLKYSMYRISVDGEESRMIFRDEKFSVCGSPAVSPDGRWILFDVTPPEGSNASQILLMTADGEDARNLCDGLMPTWSSDGSQFACSRYEGGTGVWIMNLDGTPQFRIDDGWAAQWSPDGKSIAYTNDNSLRVFDIESGRSREVLSKRSHPYSYIYANMCWSPDSKQIVFKGRLPDRKEIAIVNMTGEPTLRKRFATQAEFGSDFAWSPDGRRILFNMDAQQRSLIHQLDLESDDPPKIVPEANTAWTWTTGCFSPDGKWMLLATPN